MGLFFDDREDDTEETGNTLKEATIGIINNVGCPHQIFRKSSTVQEVREAYSEALERGKKEGFYPVVVLCDETLEDWLAILENDEYSREDTLAGDSSGGKEILDRRYQEAISDFGKDWGRKSIEEFMGTLSGGKEISELSGFVGFKGKLLMETLLFEIPVKNPWEIIAYLPMGGWNECPEAPDMMAICRYWYEQYGAIPAVISADILEFVVEQPIQDEEKAWELAKQHYGFCMDRVGQCTETCTVGELADSLQKSTVWYFWWD